MEMRDVLPSLVPENQSYSIWQIIKSAIGKDLTRITMPIFLNEPISMLQKIAEFVKNVNIMDRAISIRDDDCKRLGLISIFVLSQYAEVQFRNRKPFNPILGETYEIVQPNYRFVSEQVSHHPPVSAFFMEGKGYNL